MKLNAFISVFKSEKGNLSIVFSAGNIDYTVFGTDIEPNAVAALKPMLVAQVSKVSNRKYYRTEKPVAVEFEQIGEVEHEVDPDTGKVRNSAFACISAIAPASDNLAQLSDLEF